LRSLKRLYKVSQKKVYIKLAYRVNETYLWCAGGMSTNCLASRNSFAMERFSGSDSAFCVQEFYKNGDSPTIARRKFSSHRGLRNLNDAPSVSLIRKWVEKFEETGSTLEKPNSGRPMSSRTYEPWRL